MVLVLMLLLAKMLMTMVSMLLLVLPLVAWVLVTMVAKGTFPWPPFSLEEKIVEVKMASWVLISRPHLRTWLIPALSANPIKRDCKSVRWMWCIERDKSNWLHQIIFFSSPHSTSVIIFQILWNSLGSWSMIVFALLKHAPKFTTLDQSQDFLSFSD